MKLVTPAGDDFLMISDSLDVHLKILVALLRSIRRVRALPAADGDNCSKGECHVGRKDRCGDWRLLEGER